MGYAELIERLQALPAEKQAEVFDFSSSWPGAMPCPPRRRPWPNRRWANACGSRCPLPDSSP